MRWIVTFGALLYAACVTEPSPPAPNPSDEIDNNLEIDPDPDPVVSSVATVDAPAAAAPAPAAWTFAVISDLHLPNPKTHQAELVIAQLIALKVRFVVITGDSTNGNKDDHKRSFRGEGWDAVLAALAPLHEAGIPVLPVAGNHDSYESWMSDEYAKAFSDLQGWAAPLTINPLNKDGTGHARPPFSYSVDVDGVHLALTHLVAQSVEPDVAQWLRRDLDQARGAKQRIVFGHVPMVSIIGPPHANYVSSLGGILERGHATMLVTGHEHTVWDEDVFLPGGSTIREVLIGCSSGAYNYGPSEHSRERASCVSIKDSTRKDPRRCAMPHGGGVFEVSKRRKGRYMQHTRTTFSLFDVSDTAIDVRPMTLDKAGNAIPFYLDRR